MFIFYFLNFYASAYFAYAKPWECVLEREVECNSISEEFLDTVSKLEEACSVVQEYYACYINILEECGNTHELEFWRDFDEYIKSVCDEDSPTFELANENFRCLADSMRQIIDDDPCRKIYQSGPEMSEVVKNFLENYERKIHRRCPTDSYMATCESLVVSVNCGDELDDAAYDFFSNAYYPVMKRCRGEAQETLRKAFRDALISEQDFMNIIGRNNSSSDD